MGKYADNWHFRRTMAAWACTMAMFIGLFVPFAHVIHVYESRSKDAGVPVPECGCSHACCGEDGLPHGEAPNEPSEERPENHDPASCPICADLLIKGRQYGILIPCQLPLGVFPEEEDSRLSGFYEAFRPAVLVSHPSPRGPPWA